MNFESIFAIAIFVLFLVFFLLLMKWYTEIKNNIAALKNLSFDLVDVLESINQKRKNNINKGQI